jgi:hypothetical protein
MGRFVAALDRSQTTLFPECLDDWIDENNPVRVVDAFVEAVDLGELGFDGVTPEATGRFFLSSLGPAQALHLWLSEPGAIEPSARRGSRSQRRGDVADGSSCSRPQDDRRFSEGPRLRHSQSLRTVHRALPCDGAAVCKQRRDRWQQVQGGE